mmetsp:Transcript_93866/g.251188  ORF Transcript_93866/g.251188 Transcript_93866/m.251188 type:complete len:211 (+) Transcript_93866:328-960(+)
MPSPPDQETGRPVPPHCSSLWKAGRFSTHGPSNRALAGELCHNNPARLNRCRSYACPLRRATNCSNSSILFEAARRSSTSSAFSCSNSVMRSSCPGVLPFRPTTSFCQFCRSSSTRRSSRVTAAASRATSSVALDSTSLRDCRNSSLNNDTAFSTRDKPSWFVVAAATLPADICDTDRWICARLSCCNCATSVRTAIRSWYATDLVPPWC